MASPANAEASEVRRRGRQRLIGAIALVAVLVVFVPMVLDSEPRQQPSGPDLRIPSKTDAPPLPAPPVTPAKAGAQSSSVAPAPVTPAPGKGTPEQAAAPVTPAQAPVTPAQAPVTSAPAPVTPAKAGAQSSGAQSPKADPKAAEAKVLEPSKPPPPKAAPSPDPAPRLEGFAVQVGAFRDEDKLRQARQKLAAAKVPHYTERLEAKGGALTRLRAGPFPTREAAESALATLKRSALDGKVVTLP